jgi:hypothetical protein
MWHSAESNLIIECLCEYELIFKTALAHESGDQGYFLQKKPRVQNLVILLFELLTAPSMVAL